MCNAVLDEIDNFKEEGEDQLNSLNLLQHYINIRNTIAKQLGRVMIP